MIDAPTFAAVLGVKDEVELVAGCIAHLRAIGVDTIRVIDSGSTDGTVELIQGPLAGPDLALVHHSDQDPDSDAWSRTASALGRESGADWVLFLDADEFWIPAGGTLQSICGLAELDVLTVDRFNVPLDALGLRTPDRGLPSGPDLELIVDSLPDFRTRMEQDPRLPWIRIVPDPKVMARAGRIGHVMDGFHDILPSPGPPLRRACADDVLVAHVPFSTLPRFRGKVRNIRLIFEAHDAYCGADIAWHWRRLLACTDEDSIRREFELQVFDEPMLAVLRESGCMRTAAQWFASRIQPPAA